MRGCLVFLLSGISTPAITSLKIARGQEIWQSLTRFTLFFARWSRLVKVLVARWGNKFERWVQISARWCKYLDLWCKLFFIRPRRKKNGYLLCPLRQNLSRSHPLRSSIQPSNQIDFQLLRQKKTFRHSIKLSLARWRWISFKMRLFCWKAASDFWRT